jgi:hypothetical protein
MRRTNICAVVRKDYDARRKEKEKQQRGFHGRSFESGFR